jgi:hypothetical protein
MKNHHFSIIKKSSFFNHQKIIIFQSLKNHNFDEKSKMIEKPSSPAPWWKNPVRPCFNLVHLFLHIGTCPPPLPATHICSLFIFLFKWVVIV